MQVAIIILVVVLALGSFPLHAQTGHSQHHTPAKSSASSAASAATFSAEVRRINKERRSVTLAHGPLEPFNMGPMTMSFAVKDPAALEAIKVGDKVRFGLEKSGENLIVTHIEPVR